MPIFFVICGIILEGKYAGCTVFTIIVLVLEYILIRMARGKLGMLFGKGNA